MKKCVSTNFIKIRKKIEIKCIKIILKYEFTLILALKSRFLAHLLLTRLNAIFLRVKPSYFSRRV